MHTDYVQLDFSTRRQVTLCNHNFSKEGIHHPDRILEEFDLLFLQDGEWDIIENEISYHLSPGSVLLLEPTKHHYSIEKCTPMMRNIYIHFTQNHGDLLTNQDNISSNLEPPPSQKYQHLLSVPKLIDASDHPEIRHSFEKVIDVFWSANTQNKGLLTSLSLESLLLQLSQIAPVSQGKTDVLISEIIHRFTCEPEVFLSPQELADTYHVSIRTISGRFKVHTGMSIHQYQLQLKLEMAYDLLPISPGRSLHDIALSFGFYDEFQFSKLFKRKFGISPSERR